MARTIEEMQSFEPASLIPFFKEQYPKHTWLEEALNTCKIVEWESSAYCRLVPKSSNPNEPDSTWKFKWNFDIQHPIYWIVVLDVLEGDVLGGIEFVGNIAY